MVITEEQIVERANYLGGSDVAKILGRSRWGTPLSTYMAKCYPAHDESEHRIGGKNEASYWGNELEDKVCEAFTKVTGKKVARVNETLIHPEHDFIRANIDRRVVGEDAILEAKTCSAFKAKDWEENEIPEEYILQVMHYLAVTGKDVAYVAVLIGGQKFVWKEVRRDEELIKMIVDAEVDFWQNFIIPRIPPLATGSDKDSDILEGLYPTAQPDSQMELEPATSLMLLNRETIIKEIDELEEKKAAIENRIKEAMKDVETATSGGYKITWKNQSATRVDSKKLKELAPDIYAQYSYTSESRVLRIAKPRKGKVDNG